MNNTDTLYTTEEVAKILKVKKTTLVTWRHTGRYNLPYLKIGRNVYYKKADVEQWIDKRLRFSTTPQDTPSLDQLKKVCLEKIRKELTVEFKTNIDTQIDYAVASMNCISEIRIDQKLPSDTTIEALRHEFTTRIYNYFYAMTFDVIEQIASDNDNLQNYIEILRKTKST